MSNIESLDLDNAGRVAGRTHVSADDLRTAVRFGLDTGSPALAIAALAVEAALISETDLQNDLEALRIIAITQQAKATFYPDLKKNADCDLRSLDRAVADSAASKDVTIFLKAVKDLLLVEKMGDEFRESLERLIEISAERSRSAV